MLKEVLVINFIVIAIMNTAFMPLSYMYMNPANSSSICDSLM